MRSTISIEESTGNVFEDLGLEEAQECFAKAELAARILKIVQDRGMTQATAGRLLGISQPKVSALLHGRLDGFSTDRLFRFLNALGCDVQIKVSKARLRSQGSVRVMS